MSVRDAGTGVHVAWNPCSPSPESMFTIPGIRVHDALEWMFTFGWNLRSRCPGIRIPTLPGRGAKVFCSAGKGDTVAVWRLSSLPRYLSERELERTIDSCEVDTFVGVRDLAILLLLARLGLRSSDVAALRLFDFDWQDATILVSGKSRREERLPLPQEVGDAVLKYLEVRPRLDTEPVVFLRIQAPWQPLSPAGISSLAGRAMRRTGVSTPSGAHVLRHTAATQMLRQGVPLDDIRILLRHRSVDMTATYAKVDLELLQQVAQPWPEVLQCS